MNYVRYLGSKRTVDDRALNTEVIRRFEEILRARKAELPWDQTPLRVLEIGAGIGAMVVRLWRLGVFKQYACHRSQGFVFAAVNGISRLTY
jgi:hypothetical protein